VDTARVNPIKHIKYLERQKEWGWPIAVYLYLAGIGAGSFIIGLLMDWLGYHSYPSRAILLWGPILVAIGAPFLILDLGIKRRFLSACLNPRSSWVARGFLILSVFIIIGLTIFGMSVFPFHGLNEQSAPFRILEGIGLIFAFATAIYTGVLLQSVKYISLWNTPLLPLLFLVSALSTGSMGIILSTLGYGLLVPYGEYPAQPTNMLMLTEQTLILIEGLVLGLYLFFRYKTKEQGENSVRLLVSGDLKFVFWGGIIVSGFLFPIILEYLYSKFPDYPFLVFLTGFFLLLGGLFLRVGILSAGIKEQPPLHKLIETRYNLRT